jgi:hypothetical protein
MLNKGLQADTLKAAAACLTSALLNLKHPPQCQGLGSFVNVRCEYKLCTSI